MTSRLELLHLPEKIETPVVQVQVHSVYDSYFFGIHYTVASHLNPLLLSLKGQGPEYINPHIPNIYFSFDPHYEASQLPTRKLPHSSVYGGIDFSGSGYQKAIATCLGSAKEAKVLMAPSHTAYRAKEIDEATVQEVVDALAGNRLRPPNWKQKESAFQIDERDKPLLVAFMLEQLVPYVGR